MRNYVVIRNPLSALHHPDTSRVWNLVYAQSSTRKAKYTTDKDTFAHIGKATCLSVFTLSLMTTLSCPIKLRSNVVVMLYKELID